MYFSRLVPFHFRQERKGNPVYALVEATELRSGRVAQSPVSGSTRYPLPPSVLFLFVLE
jgi:hypothetical protein